LKIHLINSYDISENNLNAESNDDYILIMSSFEEIKGTIDNFNVAQFKADLWKVPGSAKTEIESFIMSVYEDLVSFGNYITTLSETVGHCKVI
jgi:hypothetical protein